MYVESNQWKQCRLLSLSSRTSTKKTNRKATTARTLLLPSQTSPRGVCVPRGVISVKELRNRDGFTVCQCRHIIVYHDSNNVKKSILEVGIFVFERAVFSPAKDSSQCVVMSTSRHVSNKSKKFILKRQLTPKKIKFGKFFQLGD